MVVSEQGPPSLTFEVNGEAVEVPDLGWSLLDVLRHHLGLTSVKDGCSPQGQCGCCTVLVDGSPRVACVTPARRCRGRSVTTLEGLAPDRQQGWGEAFCAAGASQCGFCTPGIILRLDPLTRRDDPAAADQAAADQAAVDQAAVDQAAVDHALLAHLCRCTGWQTIGEAYHRFVAGPGSSSADPERDLDAAAERATIEGGTAQLVSPQVALGRGGFAADTAPEGCLVAVADGHDGWAVGESLAEARAAAGKVQGRRTTAAHRHPLEVPPGPWDLTLRTTWVDGAYLETDAAWCEPGGQPTSPVANGGAFGAKGGVLGMGDGAFGAKGGVLGMGDGAFGAKGGAGSSAGPLDMAGVARELADRHGRAVLVLASREDVARHSPKRPPVAGGIRADGTGILRVAVSPGSTGLQTGLDHLTDSVAAVAPGLAVEPVEVPGPPTSSQVRAAGWAEAIVLAAGAAARAGQPVDVVRSPAGAEARAAIEADGTIRVSVRCGPVLDHTVLRSYCIGAAHMAWSWLTSEAMSVDADGTVHDLTVRSLGVLRAVDTPPIEVDILDGSTDGDGGAWDGPPVNGSDAAFAAVAAAGWLARDCPQDWPIGQQ